MQSRGRSPWSLPLAALVGLVGLFSLAACGGGGGGGSLADGTLTQATTTSTVTELQPCADDRHVVVVNLGFVTMEGLQGLEPWVASSVPPTPRPGAAQMLQAYRQRGYELLYITTGSPDLFPGRTVDDVITEWLQANGFPVDAGTHTWNGNAPVTDDEQSWVQITDELIRLANEGATVDYAYTDSPSLSHAFATGGVVPEHNYTVTPDPGSSGSMTGPTSPIPNDDLVAHTAAVEQLPAVCQTG
jgi:hypothetical protein